MLNLQKLSLLELSEKEKTYDSVYLTADTYKVSILATGCLLQVYTYIHIIKNSILFTTKKKITKPNNCICR